MWCLLFDNEYLLLGNDILSSGENCGSDVGGLVRGKTEGNIAVALPALRNKKLVWWQVFAQMIRVRASEKFWTTIIIFSCVWSETVLYPQGP